MNDPRSRTSEDAPLAEACAAFRGRLSEYLDGGLAHDDRRVADTHVAACSACRQLADEIEAAERALAYDIDEAAAAPLPAGFAGAILARTVHEVPTAGRIGPPAGSAPGGVVPWLGWVAAAALVVFNLAVWNVNQPSASSPTEMTTDFAPARVPSTWQISSTLDGPAPPPASVAETEDLSSLYAAATLIEAFAGDTGDVDAAGDFAASVIAYDELIPRLGAIARQLPPEAAATVEMTRGLLEALADGNERDRVQLQRRLAGGDIAAALRRLEVRLGGDA
jgi:hypothetical protein